MTTQDEAFERYVLPEIEVMLRVARSLTRNHADAEDLVQDTMLRAYRAIERFDGRHPRAWLLTILRNTHVNRNRRRRPELLRNPDMHVERAEQVVGVDEATQPESVVDREFDHEVRAALASLPPTFGVAVELVDLDGLSYAEAAEVLAVPIGTVMSRLHRGRRRMREQLRRTGAAPTHHDLAMGGAP